jgi:hypothetical protein
MEQREQSRFEAGTRTVIKIQLVSEWIAGRLSNPSSFKVEIPEFSLKGSFL